jgi:hypothetical protein
MHNDLAGGSRFGFPYESKWLRVTFGCWLLLNLRFAFGWLGVGWLTLIPLVAIPVALLFHRMDVRRRKRLWKVEHPE